MSPLKHSSPSTPPPPTSKKPRKEASSPSSASNSSSSNWKPEEDAMLLRLRTQTPAVSYSDIAKALGGARTVRAVRGRWARVVQFEDYSSAVNEALNEVEKNLLEKAVSDVENMVDKWWFVAVRYAELRKAKPAEARDLGNKTKVRKWAESLAREKEKKEKEKELDKDVVAVDKTLNLLDDGDSDWQEALF
ncbi:hypothetical protein FN846DRAFT_944001 [Sphaerosporella brunnea]|uniref:Myb-like domain-containing protein n=1 Tax=Sphaerosporella brunnea TaxID=1250544 RepID=A0A5J5F126_9PEZI|nr:hypothetical protein FN846DRAFT_944001 [Sphaerosporella brunnea]